MIIDCIISLNHTQSHSDLLFCIRIRLYNLYKAQFRYNITHTEAFLKSFEGGKKIQFLYHPIKTAVYNFF